MPRAAVKKRAYHHGDLRRALLEAALAIVASAGPSALTIRDVARRVGVSQAAPYHHFADKDALLAAVAQEGFVAFTAALVAGRARGGTKVAARLRELGAAYVAFAVANPSALRVMFGGAVCISDHPTLKQTADGAFAVLLESMLEGQKAGVLRRGDPSELALLAWSMLHGLAMLWLDGALHGPTGAPVDVEQLARKASDAIVRGLSG